MSHKLELLALTARTLEQLQRDLVFQNTANYIDDICPFAAANLRQGQAQIEAAQQSIHLAQLHMARALAGR